jgi:hypothetical protein
MSLTGAAVLTIYTSAPIDRVFLDPEKEAWRHLGKASYRQFNIDDYVKDIERRYVPRWVVRNAGTIMVFAKIIDEQKISYTWRF